MAGFIKCRLSNMPTPGGTNRTGMMRKRKEEVFLILSGFITFNKSSKNNSTRPYMLLGIGKGSKSRSPSAASVIKKMTLHSKNTACSPCSRLFPSIVTPKQKALKQ